LVTLPKNCCPRALGSVVIQLYAGECTPSVDRALPRVREVGSSTQCCNKQLRKRLNIPIVG